MLFRRSGMGQANNQAYLVPRLLSLSIWVVVAVCARRRIVCLYGRRCVGMSAEDKPPTLNLILYTGLY